MAFLYDLTTILNAGGWGNVTKPVITELDTTPEGELDHNFENYRRIIRIARVAREPKERSLGRGTESGESIVNYTLEIKSYDKTDCDEILDQIRDIMITDNDYSIYSDIRIGVSEDSIGRGIHYEKCPVTCYRTGKARVVPT